MNGTLTLGGPFVTSAYLSPVTARSVVVTMTVGPFPDATSSIQAVVQQKDNGGKWIDCGGLSAAGSGETFSATTHHDYVFGRRFRVRVDVVGGPVPVTFTMTAN